VFYWYDSKVAISGHCCKLFRGIANECLLLPEPEVREISGNDQVADEAWVIGLA